MKKEPFPIIRAKTFSSYGFISNPQVGEEIPGYGVVTDVRELDSGDSTYIVRIGKRKTVVVDAYDFHCIIFIPDRKPIFFTELRAIPQVGCSYKMERYKKVLDKWMSSEIVISGTFIKVEKVWNGLYYAESRGSAYYIAVK